MHRGIDYEYDSDIVNFNQISASFKDVLNAMIRSINLNNDNAIAFGLSDLGFDEINNFLNNSSISINEKQSQLKLFNGIKDRQSWKTFVSSFITLYNNSDNLEKDELITLLRLRLNKVLEKCLFNKNYTQLDNDLNNITELLNTPKFWGSGADFPPIKINTILLVVIIVLLCIIIWLKVTYKHSKFIDYEKNMNLTDY